jgi:hypothetical protein
VHDKLVNWRIWKLRRSFVALCRGIAKLFQSPARRTPPAVSVNFMKMKHIIFLISIILVGCNNSTNDYKNSTELIKTNPDIKLLNKKDSIKPFLDTLTNDIDTILRNKPHNISIGFVPVPDYIEFEGTMETKGMINLVMYTDYDKAYGKYYYHNEPDVIISFKGYFGIGWDFANIELIEYSKSNYIDAVSNNSPQAILSGVIRNNLLIGEWKDLKSNKILPFKLFKKNFKRGISYRRYYLETKINNAVFINDFKTELDAKCPPKLDKYFFKNIGYDNYLLIFISHYTNCSGSEYGNCGAGMERFLIYQHLNSKINLQLQQIIQFESCITDNNLSIIVDDNSPNGSDDDMIKKLNFNDFSCIYLVSDTLTYTLQNKDLNSGFVLIKKE